MKHFEKEKAEFKSKVVKSSEQAQLFKTFMEVFLSKEVDQFNELVKLVSDRYRKPVEKLAVEENKALKELQHVIKSLEKERKKNNDKDKKNKNPSMQEQEDMKRKRDAEIKLKEIENKKNSSILGLEQFLREANLILT